MSIVRVEKRENPFVQIDKTPINDNRLSWKAKGLLIYLLSKPNNWKVRISDLVNHATDGEKAVYSALQELEDCGYVIRKQIRETNGVFGEIEYTILEIPLHNEPSQKQKKKMKKSPQPQKGDTVKTQENQGLSPYPHFRHAENGEHNNNDYTNNEFKEDDEEDINKQPFSDFQQVFIDRAEEEQIGSFTIQETVNLLGDIELKETTYNALQETFRQVLRNYRKKTVRHFPSYFASTLVRELERFEYIKINELKEKLIPRFKQFNWLKG